MARNQRDITFATLNLYNLQLPGAPRYATSRPYSEDEYEDKIDWTADMLLRLEDFGTDVMAFQELWNRQCLIDAFVAAGLAEDYAFAFITDGDWDGIAVACAVRKPWVIRNVTRHKAFPDGFRLKKRKRSMANIRSAPPAADLVAAMDEDEEEEAPETLPSHEDDAIEVMIDEFARSPLQVTVGHDNATDVPDIEVICAHLKSKLPTRLDDAEFNDPLVHPHRAALGAAISTIRRTAEAAALRVILNEIMAGTDTPSVVVGDLNDGRLSDTLAILSDQPSYRLYADSRAAGRNDDGLYTAATLQQLRSLRDVYYTHEFKGILEVLDHVLVSEQFYDHCQRRRWSFREMVAWTDNVLDDDPATSDHGVVAAAFDWNPVNQCVND